MQRVLAIDPGSHIGWALRNGAKTYYGTEDFSKFSGVDGRVHSKFTVWLRSFLEASKPELIVIEAAIFRGANSEYLYGFAVIAIMLAFERGIPIQKAHLSAVKKYISGDGRADKAAVIKAVSALGYSPNTDHEADALAILHFQQSHAADVAIKPGRVVSVRPRALNRIKRNKRKKA
jgi:crossover junction endodeoxyribonuclease RuvC